MRYLLVILFSIFLCVPTFGQETKPACLKILSWNIYMLPGVVPVPGRLARAHAIVDSLLPSDFDIIVFQEAFLKKARTVIQDGLRTVYPYTYGPINDTPGIKANGGVWIRSKTPLSILKTIEFTDCSGIDCMARKGAIIIEGIRDGRLFQLVGTHLQAGPNQRVRYAQMDSIYECLLEPFAACGVPQIIAGDMNTEANIEERYVNMLHCLDATNDTLIGPQWTYNGRENEIARSMGMCAATTYDYIMLKSNETVIQYHKCYISIIKHGENNLSDHYGVVYEICF